MALNVVTDRRDDKARDVDPKTTHPQRIFFQREVWPSVTLQAPMTGTLDTNGCADLRLASTRQKGEKQALDYLPTDLSKKEYW